MVVTSYGAVLPAVPPLHYGLDNDEAINEALRYLDTSDEKLAEGTLATPPTSSPTAPFARADNLALSKRIRFDSKPTCIEEALSDRGSQETGSRTGTTTSKTSKSPKSILKPFDSSSSPPREGSESSDSLSVPTAFPAMLNYAITQLANGSHVSKIDAYRAMFNCSKNCTDRDDRSLYLQKLPLLEDFMKRDMARTENDVDLEKKRLALEAAKVSVLLFVEEYQLYPRLSNDFVTWLWKNTAGLLSSATPNKERAKNQLLLLTYPGFCSRAMNNDRVSFTVRALCTIHEKISGYGLQTLRLSITTGFLDKHMTVVLAHIRQWLPLAFHGLLSNSKDLRIHALNLLQRASNKFGSDKTATTALVEFLDLPADRHNTNFGLLETRVLKLLKSGNDDALEVPRIWSTVIMFLRGLRGHLRKWKYFDLWLKTIQRCFNTSNDRVHARAFVAWNYFVAALRQCNAANGNLSSYLCQPSFQYLQRNQTRPAVIRGREAAIASFRLVLFFAFDPNANAECWKVAWTAYIDKAIKELVPKDAQFAEQLDQTFSALFSRESRVWNTSLVHLGSIHPIEPCNIPRLAPTWVREQLSDVLLPSVYALVPLSSAEATYEHDRIRSKVAQTLFQGIVESVLEARNKEVKASPETLGAFRQITGFLLELLKVLEKNQCVSRSANNDLLLQCAWCLIEIALEKLGAEHFNQPLGRVAAVPPGVDPSTPVIVFVLKLMLNLGAACEARVDLSCMWSVCQSSKNGSILQGCLSSQRQSVFRTTSVSRENHTSPDSASPMNRHAAPIESRSPSSRPRPRYNDSQVDFVSIESTTKTDPRPDSQNFTDHQREVRQRQIDDGAIYSAFRSSSPLQQTPNTALRHGRWTNKSSGQPQQLLSSSENVMESNMPSPPPETSPLNSGAKQSEFAGAALDISTSKALKGAQPPSRDAYVNDELEHLADQSTEEQESPSFRYRHASGHPLGLDGQVASVAQDAPARVNEAISNVQLAEDANVAPMIDTDIAERPSGMKDFEDPHTGVNEATTVHFAEDAKVAPICDDRVEERPSRIEDFEDRRAGATGAETASRENARPSHGPEANAEVVLRSPIKECEHASEPAPIQETSRIDDSFIEEQVPNPRPEDYVPIEMGGDPINESHDLDEQGEVDVIHEFSGSPPRSQAVVLVDVPQTSSNSSGNIEQHREIAPEPPTEGLSDRRRSTRKRKASSQPTYSLTAKRTRVPDTVPRKTASQALPSSSSSDHESDDSGDCIVLGKPTFDSPKRERKSSSRVQSSTPAQAAAQRRGRLSRLVADTSESDQPASRKRTSSAFNEAEQSTSSHSKRRRQTPEAGRPSLRSTRQQRDREHTRSGSPEERRLIVKRRSSRRKAALSDENRHEPSSDQSSQGPPGVDEQPLESTGPEFTFNTSQPATPSANRSSSVEQLSPSSTARLARSVTSTLKSLFKDVKRLFMGHTDVQEQRQALEDTYDDLGQQIRAAGRRG